MHKVTAAPVPDTVPAPAEPTFHLEVEALGSWWPAVTGDTPEEDRERSTFPTIEAAALALDGVLAGKPRAVRLVRSDGPVVYSMHLGVPARPLVKGAAVARLRLTKKERV